MNFDPEKIISLRKKKDLNQMRLAALIGVKPPVVWNWEHGKHAPSARLLLRLAEVLEVSPEYFFVQSVS